MHLLGLARQVKIIGMNYMPLRALSMWFIHEKEPITLAVASLRRSAQNNSFSLESIWKKVGPEENDARSPLK